MAESVCLKAESCSRQQTWSNDTHGEIALVPFCLCFANPRRLEHPYRCNSTSVRVTEPLSGQPHTPHDDSIGDRRTASSDAPNATQAHRSKRSATAVDGQGLHHGIHGRIFGYPKTAVSRDPEGAGWEAKPRPPNRSTLDIRLPRANKEPIGFGNMVWAGHHVKRDQLHSSSTLVPGIVTKCAQSIVEVPRHGLVTKPSARHTSATRSLVLAKRRGDDGDRAGASTHGPLHNPPPSRGLARFANRTR